MRRTPSPTFLLVLLAVVVGTATVIVGRPDRPADDVVLGAREGRDGVETGRGAVEAPSLRGVAAGAGEASQDSEAGHAVSEDDAFPRDMLRVRVQSAPGAASLEGAVVYLLPKTSGGEQALDHVRRPDVKGLALFAGADPRGHWIGAYDKHHVPTFADGDEWSGGEVVLSLEAGRDLEVEVHDDARRLPDGNRIVVGPPRPKDGWRYPGPGRRLRLWRSVELSKPGTTTMRLPTRRTVRVRVATTQRYAEPPELQVPPETTRIEFTLRPVCRIRLEVTDAMSGQSLEYDAEARILDLATGREVKRVAPSVLSKAADWKESGFRPGRYAVVVDAPGYAPFSAARILLEAPGDEVHVEAPLELEAAAGRVVLHLQLPEGEVLEERVVHVRDRALEGDPDRLFPWTRLDVRQVDVEAATVSLWPVSLGEHEFLVWANGRRVGRAVVAVKGGPAEQARVVLGPGVVVDVATCPLESGEAEAAEGDAETFFLEVWSPEGVPLPRIQWQMNMHRGIGIGGGSRGSDWLVLVDEITRNNVLGPYPFPEVRVGQTGDADGATWIVRRE